MIAVLKCPGIRSDTLDLFTAIRIQSVHVAYRAEAKEIFVHIDQFAQHRISAPVILISLIRFLLL